MSREGFYRHLRAHSHASAFEDDGKERAAHCGKLAHGEQVIGEDGAAKDGLQVIFSPVGVDAEGFFDEFFVSATRKYLLTP